MLKIAIISDLATLNYIASIYCHINFN